MSGYRIALRCIGTDKTRDCATSKWTNLTATTNSAEIYSLTSWTKYEIHITAYNKLGESPANVTFATTLETGMPDSLIELLHSHLIVTSTWKEFTVIKH